MGPTVVFIGLIGMRCAILHLRAISVLDISGVDNLSWLSKRSSYANEIGYWGSIISGSDISILFCI